MRSYCKFVFYMSAGKTSLLHFLLLAVNVIKGGLSFDLAGHFMTFIKTGLGSNYVRFWT